MWSSHDTLKCVAHVQYSNYSLMINEELNERCATLLATFKQEQRKRAIYDRVMNRKRLKNGQHTARCNIQTPIPFCFKKNERVQIDNKIPCSRKNTCRHAGINLRIDNKNAKQNKSVTLHEIVFLILRNNE